MVTSAVTVFYDSFSVITRQPLHWCPQPFLANHMNSVAGTEAQASQAGRPEVQDHGVGGVDPSQAVGSLFLEALGGVVLAGKVCPPWACGAARPLPHLLGHPPHGHTCVQARHTGLRAHLSSP